jgi:hypothetical protein
MLHAVLSSGRLLVEIEPSLKSVSLELKGRQEICDLELLQFLNNSSHY